MAFSPQLLERLSTTREELEKNLVRNVRSVFGAFVGTDNLLHLPLMVDPTSHFTDCMSAMVGLAGNHNGVVSLHLPTSLARRITCLVLEISDPSEDDVEDTLGELVNILAGAFKLHLAKESLAIRLSTPSIVTGTQYVIHITKKPEVVTLLFDSDEDWFMTALALEPE